MRLRAASMRLRSLCMTLLVALALTQTLGLVHRIVHAPAVGHPAYSMGGTVAAQPSSGIGWLKSLFAGHSSEQGCDLYDQFSHADGIPTVPAWTVPPEAGDRAIAWHAALPMAAQAAGYLARGPPQAS